MPKKRKGKSESVKVIARIREFLPWESDKQLYEIQNKNELAIPAEIRPKFALIGHQQIKNLNVMKFDDIIDRHQSTLDAFNVFGRRLCDNLLETGFNSLLIGYGQTGSGKTFTLLGDPDGDGKGLLTLSIEYMLKSDKVKKCFICAKELYSTKATKIEMFDLFDSHNVSNQEWSNKKVTHYIADSAALKKTILKDTNIAEIISQSQVAAHYAPTGQNPQSSRGHIAYIVEIWMNDGHLAHFICLDLAGSEGLSALTPSFIKRVGDETSKVRLMEGGAINYGLTQIRDLLQEVGSSSGVSNVQGVGIRKLLWKYLQKKNQPAVSVIFTISPSMTNYVSTTHTFRTARAIGVLTIRPVKVVTKMSSENAIILTLKEKIREQEIKIEKLEKMVKELQGNQAEEFVQIEDYGDLKRQRQGLIELKKDLMERNKSNPDELTRNELKEVTIKLDRIGLKMKAMKKLNNKLNVAMADDFRRNSVMNVRMSQLASMQKGINAALNNMNDGQQSDSIVKIQTEELISLKQHLDDLANKLDKKQRNVAKNNDDLAAFVKQLEAQQIQILNQLDSAM